MLHAVSEVCVLNAFIRLTYTEISLHHFVRATYGHMPCQLLVLLCSIYFHTLPLTMSIMIS